jgi:hypothetical protein
VASLRLEIWCESKSVHKKYSWLVEFESSHALFLLHSSGGVVYELRRVRAPREPAARPRIAVLSDHLLVIAFAKMFAALGDVPPVSVAIRSSFLRRRVELDHDS